MRYVIHGRNGVDYGEGNKNGTSIKFETKSTKSNLCDYSDAYILVTRYITATNGDADTNATFKNYTPFTKCISNINDEHVVIMNIVIIIQMHLEVKRDESPINAGNPDDVTTNNSSSFKYKSSILGKSTVDDNNNGVLKNAKIAAPLKYLSNFWRSLEMHLINCKIHLELS